MSSISPISSLAGGQAVVWPTSLADQVGQGLQTLMTALQSGDTAGATQALTALETLAKTSAPVSALLSTNSQVLGDLALIRQALDSGNAAMISSAFSVLQGDLNAAGQLQRAAAPAIQEPGSGDSITLNSASAALQRSVAVAAGLPSTTISGASLAYAATSISAPLPEGLVRANSMAIQAEANLLSAQSAEEAARMTIPVNPNVLPDLGAHGTTYLTGLLLLSIIVILLFCLF
jgi:hypothetical protein